MIRINPAPTGPNLEISLHRAERTHEQALDVIAASLSRSRFDSHQVTADDIARQCARGASLVHVRLNRSALRRIESSLRYVFSKRRLYPTRGHADLHEAVCRALDIRLSTAQAA